MPPTYTRVIYKYLASSLAVSPNPWIMATAGSPSKSRTMGFFRALLRVPHYRGAPVSRNICLLLTLGFMIYFTVVVIFILAGQEFEIVPQQAQTDYNQTRRLWYQAFRFGEKSYTPEAWKCSPNFMRPGQGTSPHKS
jgi:hypothetical protein